MSPRRIGFLSIGVAVATAGGASLIRCAYVPMPLWRREVAWGCLVVGLVFLLGSLRKDRISS